MKFNTAVKEAESTIKKAKDHIAKKKAQWKPPKRNDGVTGCDGNTGKTGNPEDLSKK